MKTGRKSQNNEGEHARDKNKALSKEQKEGKGWQQGLARQPKGKRGKKEKA